MDGGGSVQFDKGVVIDNNDEEKRGRVKVRFDTDGVNEESCMHRGDDELFWYSPISVGGGGFEVGSLVVPPIGAYVWCLTCKYSTDSFMRVYLGGSFGVGSKKSKNFNGMDAPTSVNEMPTEALIDYPNTQLLYKSTQGSFLKFMGDTKGGFEASTGIPIEDKDGNSNKTDTDTYNYIRADRDHIHLGISEMPSKISKGGTPKEPDDIPISYADMAGQTITHASVRDRKGTTFNSHVLNEKGLFVTVRGTGGTSNPSDNSERLQAAEKALDEAPSVAEQAVAEQKEQAEQPGGEVDQAKEDVGTKVEETTQKSSTTEAFKNSEASGIPKDTLSEMQKTLEGIADKIPGGMATVNGVVNASIRGNTDALMSQAINLGISVALPLIQSALQDVMKDILEDVKLIDKSEAAKFVQKIMGEANLEKLQGRASEIIDKVGAKLGPFEWIFKKVANTILTLAVSKLASENDIINKISSLSNVKSITSLAMKEAMNLISKNISVVAYNSMQVAVSRLNDILQSGDDPLALAQALQAGCTVNSNVDLSVPVSTGNSVYDNALADVAYMVFGKDASLVADKEQTGSTDTGSSEGGQASGSDAGSTEAGSSASSETGSGAGNSTGGSETGSASGSKDNSEGSSGSGESENNSGTASDGGSSASETEDNSGSGSDASSDGSAESDSSSAVNEDKQLTPEEVTAVGNTVTCSVNSAKEAMEAGTEKAVKGVVSKSLNDSATQSAQTAKSTKEWENILYLDADGGRVAIPGEEMSNYCQIDNDGARVHIGENSLSEINQSNITDYIGDVKQLNSSARVMASNGTKTRIDYNDTENQIVANSTIQSTGLSTEFAGSLTSSNATTATNVGTGMTSDFKQLASVSQHSLKMTEPQKTYVFKAFQGYDYNESSAMATSTITEEQTGTSFIGHTESVVNYYVKDLLGNTSGASLQPKNINMVSNGVVGKCSLVMDNEKNMITLKAGEASLILDGNTGNITLSSPAEISIGGMIVNLGASVNLGFVPPGMSAGTAVMKTTSLNMEVSGDTTIKSSSINISQ